MGVWMGPLQGVFQVSANTWKAALGKDLADSRLGAAIDVLSTEHSASNVVNSLKTLATTGDYKAIATEIISGKGIGLESRSAVGKIGTGFVKSADSAFFVSATIAGSSGFAAYLGASEELAGTIGMLSLFFVPGAHATTSELLKDQVSESDIQEIVAQNRHGEGDTLLKDSAIDTSRMPAQHQYKTISEAANQILYEKAGTLTKDMSFDEKSKSLDPVSIEGKGDQQPYTQTVKDILNNKGEEAKAESSISALYENGYKKGEVDNALENTVRKQMSDEIADALRIHQIRVSGHGKWIQPGLLQALFDAPQG
jgi:hypothetical protein